MHKLTSRKLVAVIFTLAAIVSVSVVAAFHTIPDFDLVIKSMCFIGALAVLGQAALDWVQIGKG